MWKNVATWFQSLTRSDCQSKMNLSSQRSSVNKWRDSSHVKVRSGAEEVGSHEPPPSSFIAAAAAMNRLISRKWQKAVLIYHSLSGEKTNLRKSLKVFSKGVRVSLVVTRIISLSFQRQNMLLKSITDTAWERTENSFVHITVLFSSPLLSSTTHFLSRTSCQISRKHWLFNFVLFSPPANIPSRYKKEPSCKSQFTGSIKTAACVINDSGRQTIVLTLCLFGSDRRDAPVAAQGHSEGCVREGQRSSQEPGFSCCRRPAEAPAVHLTGLCVSEQHHTGDAASTHNAFIISVVSAWLKLIGCGFSSTVLWTDLRQK